MIGMVYIYRMERNGVHWRDTARLSSRGRYYLEKGCVKFTNYTARVSAPVT